MTSRDPHRERAFRTVLLDVKASHENEDGRYEDLAAQLDSLDTLIREHDLKIKPQRQEICTPDAKKLRQWINNAFGGFRIFTEPMQVLSVAQKKLYFGDPLPEPHSPRELNSEERRTRQQASRESSRPSPINPSKLSNSRATSWSPHIVSPAGNVNIKSRPNGGQKMQPTKIRRRGTTGLAASSKVSYDVSREIPNSQSGNTSSDERDSAAKVKSTEVVDLSADAANKSSASSLHKDKNRTVPILGLKRNAEETLESEVSRGSKKRVGDKDEQSRVNDTRLDDLCSAGKQSADTSLQVTEQWVSKESDVFDKQAEHATEEQHGSTSRGTHHKADGVRALDERSSTTAHAHAESGPQSGDNGLAINSQESLPEMSSYGRSMPSETQTFVDRDTSNGAPKPVCQLVVQGIGAAVPGSEDDSGRGAATFRPKLAEGPKAPQQLVPDPVLTTIDLDAGLRYPANLRLVDDLKQRVTATVSAIRGIASTIVIGCDLLETPPSLMTDPDGNTERLYRQLSLEHLILQIGADRLKDNSDFDREEIQPRAKEHAESLFMSIIPQLRHMNTKLKISSPQRDKVLRSLAGVFADSLKLRGRLDAATADYQYYWLCSGTEFEKSRMQELRGYDEGGVERAMACIFPGIGVKDKGTVLVKAQVYGL
ncbi:hypothetical protein CB0940_04597 [Cercospora beticola]|uniref:Uncharacterized protein n=1 Tax=Cercospora beticola TaxID=122368 RepID=A0A2G5HLJ5_CERBT|nr:hypothetical protein CB0940_04597 [Cercospora beticola]PIA93434.1 hypothetical protein CB0940_04597 [Cercospora beticola]WPB01850.1 hypothetical protein RHO25_006482 [Cercospora beticola]